jgi:NADH-quinone oxidoreductase subunit L
MFRLMGKTFYGESHVDPHVADKVHESPPSMTIPLILLAIPTVVLGFYLGGGIFFGQETVLGGWLEPVFGEAAHRLEETMGIHHQAFSLAGIDGTLLIIGAAAGAIGVAFGLWFFGLLGFGGERRSRIEGITNRLRPLYTASFNKWWFDELNDLIFVRFGGWVARALWWFDVRVVDGTVNGIAALTQSTGRGIRQIQTGRVQNYALGIAAGLLVIAITYIFVVAR